MSFDADAVRSRLAETSVKTDYRAFFLGGLALNLTPCVYPMIPVTLAFFSQQAIGALGRVIRLACCYVLGLSSMYALLGLLAARTGILFGSWLQQPAAVALMAIILNELVRVAERRFTRWRTR